MSDRIQKELELLKHHYSEVECNQDGQWFLIRNYDIPSNRNCNIAKTDICFQLPGQYPGTPPYGFYVKAGLRFNEQIPESYKEPPENKPPFPGDWGFFSWQHHAGWKPTANLISGSNLLNYVSTFRDRFLEGK